MTLKPWNIFLWLKQKKTIKTNKQKNNNAAKMNIIKKVLHNFIIFCWTAQVTLCV